MTVSEWSFLAFFLRSIMRYKVKFKLSYALGCAFEIVILVYTLVKQSEHLCKTGSMFYIAESIFFFLK